MDKLNDSSLSQSNDGNEHDPDVSISNNNNDASDSTDETSNKFNALMNELQTSTNDFVSSICTTKSLTTKTGKIQVKPLNPVAYKMFDTFVASIDNVFKWYESENEQQRATIDSLNRQISLISEENDKKMEEIQQAFLEQQQNVDKSLDNTSALIQRYQEDLKEKEEKLEAMKAAEDELKAKCDRMEQNEAALKEKIEKMEFDAHTADIKLATMQTNLEQKDNTIAEFKQKSIQMPKDYEEKMQTMEAELARAVDAEMKAKADLFEQKEQSSKNKMDEIKKLSLCLNAAENMVTSLKFSTDLKDATIAKLEQKSAEMTKEYEEKLEKISVSEAELKAKCEQMEQEQQELKEDIKKAKEAETNAAVMLGTTMADLQRKEINVAELEEKAATMTKNHEEKIKALEEKIEEMKAIQVVMKAECDEMEQEKQAIREKLVKIEVKIIEANFERETLNSIIVQKDENIAQLEQSSPVKMAKEYEAKVKILEEKLKQIKVAEAETKVKCDQMEQKEQEIKEQVKRIEAKTHITILMYENMKSKLAQSDEDIQHYKIKFEKAFHLYQKANNGLNQSTSNGSNQTFT